MYEARNELERVREAIARTNIPALIESLREREADLVAVIAVREATE